MIDADLVADGGDVPWAAFVVTEAGGPGRFPWYRLDVAMLGRHDRSPWRFRLGGGRWREAASPWRGALVVEDDARRAGATPFDPTPASRAACW